MTAKESNKEEIAEDFPYLQELMQAIAAVRHSIDAGRDGRDAAENLLSEIPDDWTSEIQNRITEEEMKYNKIIEYNNLFLAPGHSPIQKAMANRNIYVAGKIYSRNIVKIAITLFKQKDMLFKTRKKAAEASLSIFQLGEGDIDDG